MWFTPPASLTVCVRPSPLCTQSGAILVDGIDLADLHTPSLRAIMGVVSQEPALFSGTIADNIAYGVAGLDAAPPTQEQVERAAMRALAHDFTAQFPQGYDTLVRQERTAALGGGHGQSHESR